MDRIYEFALLTIIASPPGGKYPPPDGLPGYRTGTRLFTQDVAHVQCLDICTSFPSTDMSLNKCPWGNRAWTFQEESLSKRRLCFSASQLYFQCFCGIFCEDAVGENKSPSGYIYTTSSLWNLAGLYTELGEGQDVSLEGLSRSRFQSEEQATEYYKNLVHRYTSREMTNQGDVLLALKGVMSVLSDTMETKFIFGLPEAYFDAALLWVMRDPHKRRQAISNDRHQKSFPSWSWAGWETWAFYLGNSIGDIKPEAKWFLITPDGAVSPLACSTPQESNGKSFNISDHRNISLNYDGSSDFRMPILTPRSNIKPEDVEISSVACLSSIAAFQFLGNVKEEDDPDWRERQNFVISDNQGRPVGSMWMEDRCSSEIKRRTRFEFMLLSRAEGVRFAPILDAELFPVTAWSFVNVMLIERKGTVAERLGIGVVHENAWVGASPTPLFLYLR